MLLDPHGVHILTTLRGESDPGPREGGAERGGGEGAGRGRGAVIVWSVATGDAVRMCKLYVQEDEASRRRVEQCNMQGAAESFWSRAAAAAGGGGPGGTLHHDVPCLFCCCTRMSSSCFLHFW